MAEVATCVAAKKDNCYNETYTGCIGTSPVRERMLFNEGCIRR